jgi:hypothetical protein
MEEIDGANPSRSTKLLATPSATMNPGDDSRDDLKNRLFGTIVEHARACIALLRGPDVVFEVVNPAYAAIAPGGADAGQNRRRGVSWRRRIRASSASACA